MIDKVTAKFAASALVLGLTAVGCKPVQEMSRPATASAATPRADRQAALLYDKALDAARNQDLAGALAFAEQAVELAPRDTAYRATLADLYLKNGRFVSAEAAFGDVLTLDPNNNRAALSLILAQIAQGKTGAATLRLQGLEQVAAPADVGLAYALAGQPQRAIDILEPAARTEGAEARVRQNLALAYALSGDWQKARVTAAQDVSPADLDQRMAQWASFVNPSSSYDQVAGLLGVRAVEDAGQPTRLALAPPASETTAFAAAEPVAEASAPISVAAAEPVADPVVQPAEQALYADAAQSLVEPQRPQLIRASITETPIPAFDPFKKTPRVAGAKPAKKSNGGGASSRYVVQIGAYRSSSAIASAWSTARKRYGLDEAGAPLSTKVDIPGKGQFYRLSVAGFQTPGEAGRLCQSIRAKRGACFVRVNGGDAPVQWALREGGRRGA